MFLRALPSFLPAGIYHHFRHLRHVLHVFCRKCASRPKSIACTYKGLLFNCPTDHSSLRSEWRVRQEVLIVPPLAEAQQAVFWSFPQISDLFPQISSPTSKTPESSQCRCTVGLRPSASMNRPGAAAEAEYLCRQGRTGIAIFATVMSDRSFFRSFYGVFHCRCTGSGRTHLWWLRFFCPRFHGMRASGKWKNVARPSRLSVHIVQRNESRYQQETGEWRPGTRDWGMGTRRQGDVRQSNFREAYRRMPILTIETALYRAGRFFNSLPPLEMMRCVVLLLSSDICRLSVCPLSSNL